MVDAALGTTVTVDGILDGPTEIPIAPGTQPGFAMPGALEPGDMCPVFPLATPQGAAVDLSHQAIAGDPIVLIVIAKADAAALTLVRRYGLLAEGLAKAGARLAVLCPEAAVPTLSGVIAPPMLLAIDPADGYARAAGLAATGPGTDPVSLLIAPSFRVEAVARGADQAQAISQALEVLRASEPVVAAQRQAPVLVVPEIFPRAFCDHLISVWQVGEQYDDAISRDGYSGAGASMKRRRDVGITDPALQRVVQAYLARRLMPEILRAFHFQVTQAEVYRIGCYDGTGENYFRRHRDTGLKANAHRRYALSLNLNAGAYRGGELIFPEYGQARYSPPAGGGVVFSCSLLHEALPVTEGRRFALFTFLRGQGV
jgi:predicted 2-oxoglutarate/Fe(II)-dependent dioxygenase YbiX